MQFALGKAKQFLTAVQTFDPQSSLDDDPSWEERIITAVAVSLALVVVAAVAVLMGTA